MIERKYYHPGIKWYHRLNPIWWFGNYDDPWPPAHFDGHYRDYWAFRFFKHFLPFKLAVKLWWFSRNPLHNFTRYVIGLCGRDITVHSRYPGEMFAPMGYNWFLVQWKFLFFPGLSYRGKKWRWYIGWLDSGQFGLEFRSA